MMAKKRKAEAATDDQITEHFRWSEAACGEVEVPDDLRDNARRMAEALEVVRHALGDRPIVVLSWYRTPEANAACGGSPRSRHLLAEAADIRCPPLGARTIYAVCDRLQAEGAIPLGGLHAYTDRPQERQFVHIDIRGTRARW